MTESKYNAVVAAAVSFGRPATTGEINGIVRANDNTVRKHLATAVERGVLERHGSSRYVGYRYSAHLDDAIHAMDARGDLLCGLSAQSRRKIGLKGFPMTDAGGAYCWTCLERAERVAEQETTG